MYENELFFLEELRDSFEAIAPELRSMRTL
jgi:hypothetical protein